MAILCFFVKMLSFHILLGSQGHFADFFLASARDPQARVRNLARVPFEMEFLSKP
jgi:hypothetical protein